jgi:hypothetical protein
LFNGTLHFGYIGSKLNQKQKNIGIVEDLKWELLKHIQRWFGACNFWTQGCEKIRELLNLLYARGFGACHLWEQCLQRWMNCPQTSLCARWFGACNLWAQSLKGFEIPQTSYI